MFKKLLEKFKPRKKCLCDDCRNCVHDKDGKNYCYIYCKRVDVEDRCPRFELYTPYNPKTNL